MRLEKTSLDEESAAYAAEVASRLREVVGDNLVGVYLHGSAALGDFSRDQSDIDVVAVTEQSVSDEQRRAVADKLSSKSLPVPVRELEFHLVTRKAMSDNPDAPAFELHLVSARSGADRVIDGHDRPGDPDLVMHFAVLAEHGQALLGPPASEVFPAISREKLIRALTGELEWAREHASPTYQVLNAARAWQFLESGAIGSKTEGGEWARERVHDASTIDAALKHRRGQSEEPPSSEQARAFLEGVLRRLSRARGGGPG